MREKTARQAAMLKVIETRQVETQEDLAEELKKAGFQTTQATLSRDLKEMGVGKTRSKVGKLVYATGAVQSQAWPALRRMAQDLVSEVKRAGNLVIVKTLPGYASGVATAVDNLGDKTILGSVAGDDTILVITSDEASGQAFAKSLAVKGV
ncbi:MAG: arginine repressor [Actinomycetota bacterium]